MFTFFVHMIATKAWLKLTPEEREQFVAEKLGPILAKYPHVKVAYYDVEAFSSRCSDIFVFEAEVLTEYLSLIDDLRDSEVYTVPYFEIVDIFPAKAAHFV